MSMVLDDICNSSVYDANPFYLTCLPITATSREIRRRREDLIDGVSVMGEGALRKELEKYLLGNCVPPKVSEISDSFEKLKNPEYYATVMFFWFWPRNVNRDEAIDFMLAGERDKAVRLWRSDLMKSDERGMIAKHNLAVALHYYAIDGEKHLIEMKGDGVQQYLSIVNGYWQSAFAIWDELYNDDFFWDVYAGLLAKLNDPRLGDKFLREFRARFPIAFDNINASFLLEYAQKGRLDDAKRHFNYMVSTMSGDDDIDETLERALKPLKDKVSVLIKRCQNESKPSQVFIECKKLLEESKGFVALLKYLIPKGNNYTNSIFNEIVSTIDRRLPVYSRETSDFESCLKLEKELLDIVASPLQREKILEAIKEWEELVKRKRAANTCCVCGKWFKDIGRRSVDLHRDVRRDPFDRNRIVWSIRTFENVPVCSGCDHLFKQENAVSYPPVKDAIDDGWVFGDKPTEMERFSVRY